MKLLVSILTVAVFIFVFIILQSKSVMKKPEDLFKREIHKGNTPSIQYFYFSKDSIIYSYKDCYVDVSLHRAVDFNTTYNYLADFPYGDSISIKHLLSHTGGLPNPIPLAWMHLDAEHHNFDEQEFFQSIYYSEKC